MAWDPVSPCFETQIPSSFDEKSPYNFSISHAEIMYHLVIYPSYWKVVIYIGFTQLENGDFLVRDVNVYHSYKLPLDPIKPY